MTKRKETQKVFADRMLEVKIKQNKMKVVESRIEDIALIQGCEIT